MGLFQADPLISQTLLSRDPGLLFALLPSLKILKSTTTSYLLQ